MSENKHHKQHDIERTDDMIDYISNLPDSILHHILSFLHIIEVVQTSILSKRWKNLWASIPSLEFDEFLINASERDPERYTSYMNFEEKILRSRSRDTHNIEKFRLSCHDIGVSPSYANLCISNAVMHNVRELDVRLFLNHPSAIPESVFDCKSLVILKIELYGDIQIPSRIYLPCLKILKISLVAFMNAELTQKLFSSCPVLEELVLSDCAYGFFNNITISSLTLKKLTIRDQTEYHPTHPSRCKIMINAKNLTYLEYDGLLSNEILLNNVPSIVKACIHIPLVYARKKAVAYLVIDLLKGLQNAVFLSISNCTLESLMHADMMNLFPVFRNLTRLLVTTEIKNNTFGTFMYLLNFCPSLQSISFYEGFSSCMLLNEDDSILLYAPICISYHLKTLVFKNFHANDSEIRFLNFVLKYARILEKMDVWWCKPESPDLNKQREVRKEFEVTEKSSATYIINFS